MDTKKDPEMYVLWALRVYLPYLARLVRTAAESSLSWNHRRCQLDDLSSRPFEDQLFLQPCYMSRRTPHTLALASQAGSQYPLLPRDSFAVLFMSHFDTYIYP